MCRRNPIHCSTMLLLILISYVFAEQYHIVSNDTTDQCQRYRTKTCFTLAEVASNSSHLGEDVLLKFLPGEHLLTRRLTITGSQNITMTGQNSSNGLSTIKCQGTSGFGFRDIQSLNIAYLKFTGCGNVAHGGVISISRADNVLIKGCHFFDNRVIDDSSNSTGNDDVSMGGAISVYESSISSSSNHYIHNSAGYGGAIYIYSGNITSTSDHYVNNNADYGGAIYVESGNIFSSSNHYNVHNSARYGGAIFVYSGSIYSSNDHYMSNSADNSFGGAIDVEFGNVFSINSNYTNNSAGYGGAISVYSGKISSASNQYINNSAGYRGGAMFVYPGNITSTNDHYLNNSADYGGANYAYSGDIYSNSGRYINNTASSHGGAIFAYSGSVSSCKDHYVNNSADKSFGGAINVQFGNISSVNNNYTQNWADYGGAISVYHGEIYSNSDQYINNSAGYRGGAIHVYPGKITSANNHYICNSAGHGGAIYVNPGNISSSSDHYTNNSADYGGAIFVYSHSYRYSSNAEIYGDNFKENSAIDGAVIYITGGVLVIGQSRITGNFDSNKHILYVNRVSLIFSEGLDIMNNHGSLYVFNTQVEFIGSVTFMNNLGDSGGAITAVLSKISFNTASTVTICNNTATSGGGISLTQSSLHVYHPIELTGNHATDFGGAIYAYQSEIHFKLEQRERLEISNNTASNGGAICAIASNIQISNTLADFNSNRAKLYGGAIYLEQNSKIYVQKNEHEFYRNANASLLAWNIRLDFTCNSAEKGGAIYVADNTSAGVLCQGTSSETYQTECFIQTLGAHDKLQYQDFINTFFCNNTARQSGSDIYGGLLDRCTINPNAEMIPEYKNLNGFDYIKATTRIEQIIDYSSQPVEQPEYFREAISKSDVIGLISSDAVRVEFCLKDVISPNYKHPTVSIKKGEMFTVSLVAVDQVGNPLNATIISSFYSESGTGHVKDNQVIRQVGSQCTELEYNLYSQYNEAELYIYADGPCSSRGVSKKTINIFFLPCTCPVGFQSSPSETDCICKCNRNLIRHQITSCSAENETILVEVNQWVGVSSYANGRGIVIHDCPFDYCVQEPVNISLRDSDSANKKCAYNRTGSLCGACQEDLSLVFGTSRCTDCSNIYIFLLIPFALAGIALVTFILLFNLTVAIGTIHGLIVYVNILTADHSLFLRFATPNFLTVFISWLNLDFGIETCFYNGMDSYGKFLLQLAFPTYVFVLIGIIIVLCEVSKKFSNLLSNRNPVAALCTLILLSYSKLIRTIITALQFTHLDYPDGSREIVWLYDANVLYFTVSHIPRFLAAFIIIILGTIYTILLLFGQWFPRCSNRKIMKWAKNTKYNAFVDAYHAPFTPRHRYWMGLLLFAQITHNIVAAMTTDGSVTILSAGCITLGLLLIKLLNCKIFKNRLQDTLETLFLTNIVVLAIASHHILIKEKNESHFALVNTSMAVSFILFLFILGFHFYKYILKGTRIWARMRQCCKRREHASPNRYQMQPLENRQAIIHWDTLDSNNQLREPALDIIDPVYTDCYSDPPPSPPVVHQPPKITYTVIDGRPGHRDGDPVPCVPARQNVREVA